MTDVEKLCKSTKAYVCVFPLMQFSHKLLSNVWVCLSSKMALARQKAIILKYFTININKKK